MCPPRVKVQPPKKKSFATLFADGDLEEEEEVNEEQKKEDDPFAFKGSDDEEIDLNADDNDNEEKVDEEELARREREIRRKQKEAIKLLLENEEKEREEKETQLAIQKAIEEEKEKPPKMGGNYLLNLQQTHKEQMRERRIHNTEDQMQQPKSYPKIEKPKRTNSQKENKEYIPSDRNAQKKDNMQNRITKEMEEFERQERNHSILFKALSKSILYHRNRAQSIPEENKIDEVRRHIAERYKIRYISQTNPASLENFDPEVSIPTKTQQKSQKVDQQNVKEKEHEKPRERPGKKDKIYQQFKAYIPSQAPKEEEKPPVKSDIPVEKKNDKIENTEKNDKIAKIEKKETPKLVITKQPNTNKAVEKEKLQKIQKAQVRAEKNKFAENVVPVEEVKEISIRDLPIVEENYDPNIITDQMRRAFYFFDDRITKDMTDEQLRAHEQLHMELYSHRALTPNGPACAVMEFSPVVASFIVEAFATNYDLSTKGLVDKFGPAPAGIRLSLPGPFPVSFTRAHDVIQACFFDTPGVCGVEVQNQLKFALDTFAARGMLVYRLERVLADKVEHAEVAKLGDELETIALVSKRESKDFGSNVAIYVMKAHWSEAKSRRANEFVSSLFRAAELSKCTVCGCGFQEADGSKCEERFHPGKRIPFEDGRMEGFDDAGRPTVRYDCCGVVAAGDGGCQVKENPSHTKGAVGSRMAVSDEKIF